MKRRIFIAVNLPASAKSTLFDYCASWPELPCRWTKKENLHITLLFLGYLEDQEVFEVCKSVKEIVAKHEKFFVDLEKICYAPTSKNPHTETSQSSKAPKMVWAIGKQSEELGEIQKDLEKNILDSFSNDLELESRPYSPHITLGRIKAWEFRRLEQEERPEISEEINLSFEVDSIEVMESQLERGGPKYTILEKCALNA